MTDPTTTETTAEQAYARSVQQVRGILAGTDVDARGKRLGESEKLVRLLLALVPDERDPVQGGGQLLHDTLQYSGLVTLRTFLANRDEGKERFSDAYVAGAAHMFASNLLAAGSALEAIGLQRKDGTSVSEMMADFHASGDINAAIQKQADKQEAYYADKGENADRG